MGPFTKEDLIGSLIFLVILVVVAWINLRKMKTGSYDFKALRKRGLMWTEIAAALFLLQLLLRKGDPRFLLVLGMVLLFAASQWLGAIYFDRRNKRDS
ncbi:hypothetical protein LBW89_10010 [Paenibacillus sp. alder61]|uniref:Uncharacterized protein n=1 Tax=Paenibacillus faecis TaxID=862114 RepID=A0A5D0CQ44_9BACL|nr:MULTISPECIES: hypothetical protein [Paenibacillus]MCA1293354.1 hypothetical protein [Paenibacillus sp. alder61]TYA12021.1 hypothetical protein FRY98_14885 [Paenibacillus faecis]